MSVEWRDGEVKACALTLLRSRESMVDVARILDLRWSVVIAALTDGEPTAEWCWDEHDWLAAEAAIYEGGEELRAHGITVPDVTAVRHWYERPREDECEG